MSGDAELAKIWRSAALGGFREVLATGRELTGCDLLLGDPILSVVASCCGEASSQWTWEEHIRGGYAPSFNEANIPLPGQKLFFSPRREGWRGTDPVSGRSYVLLDLHTPQGTVYHLVLTNQEERVLSENLSLIDAISEALLTLIDRSDRESKGRLSVERFLNRLLEDNVPEDEMLEARARLMDLRTEGFFVIMTIDINSFWPTEHSISTISAQLESLSDGISTIYGSRLVLLQRYPREEDSSSPAHLAELERYLKKYRLTAARSRVFFTLRDVAFHYRQTEAILRLGYCAGRDKLLDFSRMSIHLLAASLPPEERRETACHPIVRRLAALDQESKFGYLETLKAYLLSGQRAAVACQRLHIHRNTMDYRLRKMEEQVPIDWSDGALLFRLYFSICLLEVLQRE